MSELLGFVPILASATLGLIYLGTGSGSSTTRGVGIGVFVLAAYLQFFSRWMLPGVLLQCALAATLEFWRRLHA